MLYSTPNLEMSIYSTCKRISQKLLRNVNKFLDMIYAELRAPKMKEIRMNFEEIVLKGEESDQDVRVVNSYPSKVVASLKWVRVTVSTLHMLAKRCAHENRVSIRASAPSCRALSASGCQSTSLPRTSWAILRTMRVKVALGMPVLTKRRGFPFARTMGWGWVFFGVALFNSSFFFK